MRRHTLIAALIILIAACGDGTSPTSPTPSTSTTSPQGTPCGPLDERIEERQNPFVIQFGGEATGIWTPPRHRPGVWLLTITWTPSTIPMTGHVNVVDHRVADNRGAQVATLSGAGTVTACWMGNGSDIYNYKLVFPPDVRVDGIMSVKYPRFE
jgi:hypothetical protein